MPTPHRSVSFATVATDLVSRLELRFDRTPGDGFVRLVLAPSPELAPYRAEAGVHVVVYPPRPNPAGGRYDTKVVRLVEVFVVTSSLRDVGGRDDAASLAHLAMEETVVDAVRDLYPNGVVGSAVQVRWVPGQERQARNVDRDVGLIRSSLTFEVTYAFPYTVPEA